MKPEDFPQFDDPRVREVMAAAANLVAASALHKGFRQFAYTTIEACQTALFAAQHSSPHKTRTVRVEPPCGPCLLVDDVDAAQHSPPKCTCGAPGNHFPDCKVVHEDKGWGTR